MTSTASHLAYFIEIALIFADAFVLTWIWHKNVETGNLICCVYFLYMPVFISKQRNIPCRLCQCVASHIEKKHPAYTYRPMWECQPDTVHCLDAWTHRSAVSSWSFKVLPLSANSSATSVRLHYTLIGIDVRRHRVPSFQEIDAFAANFNTVCKRFCVFHPMTSFRPYNSNEGRLF